MAEPLKRPRKNHNPVVNIFSDFSFFEGLDSFNPEVLNSIDRLLATRTRESAPRKADPVEDNKDNKETDIHPSP
jgi:hypothetical protein